MAGAAARKRDRAAAPALDAIPVTPWLEHLIRHVPLAKEGTDPEGVHQLRVAVARIRVWLELGRWRVLHDDLRWLRAKAAPVRDLDVQLLRNLPPAYAEELRKERDQAHLELRVALEGERFESLLAALRVLPPLRQGRARKRFARFVRRALARGRALPRDGYACLHSVRRSVRRVRFALEWFGESSANIVELQDVLGTFGDAWIAVRRARRSDGRNGIGSHREALQRELHDAARAARRAWKRTRPALEALT